MQAPRVSTIVLISQEPSISEGLIAALEQNNFNVLISITEKAFDNNLVANTVILIPQIDNGPISISSNNTIAPPTDDA